MRHNMGIRPKFVLLCLLLFFMQRACALQFLQQPISAIAAPGQPFWWHCMAQGSGSISYRWRFNDADITGNNYRVYSNGTLYIIDVTLQTEGSYMCVVTDSETTVYSNNVQLRLASLAYSYTINPVSQIKNVGDVVTLECEIDSLPPATITWRLDGQPVTIGTVSMVTNTKSRLLLRNVQHESAGEYVCVAVNNVLQNTGRYSNTGTLVLQGRPGFKVSPSPASVPEGGTAAFDCVAVGSQPLTVEWYDVRNSDSESLIQDTGGRYNILPNKTLVIRSVQKGDGGYYKCKATNDWGDNAVTVRMTVTDPLSRPYFLSLPSATTVYHGEAASLQCQAAGTPQPVITWSKVNGSLPTSRVTYPFNGAIQINSVQSSDSGIYKCEASNSQGRIEHSVQLTVQVGPYFISHPTDRITQEGQNISIPCRAGGVPTPAIIWQTPSGTQLPAPSPVNSGVEVSSSGSLLISKVSSSHHGMYTCIASNTVGTITAAINIQVQIPPSFTTMPFMENVEEGKDAVFHCQASGRPVPVIHWYRVGSNTTITTGAQYRVYNNGTLEIISVRKYQEWIYKCVARNVLGSVSAIAPLTVKVPPTFTSSPRDFIVSLGDTVMFECSATGDPPPQIRWERGANTLVLDDNMVLFANHTLLIRGVREYQLGAYHCIASSAAGVRQMTGHLYTVDIPRFTTVPQNTTINVTKTATLRCHATARQTPSYFWFESDINGIMGNPVSARTSPGGQESSIYITSSGELVIQNIQQSDEGWYLCVARNNVANITAPAYINVYVPPSTPTTNSPQSVPSGMEAILICNSTGDPRLSWSWVDPQGQQVITGSATGYQVQNQEKGSLLRIGLVSPQHWGIWRCRACNILGCKEGEVEVQIEGPPVIQSVTASKINDQVILSCIAIGKPTPYIKYFIRHVEISPTARPAGHQVLSNGSLLIDVNFMVSEYTCKAGNAHGIAEKILTVPQPPSPPNYRSVESSSVKITWDGGLHNSLPNLAYRIQYTDTTKNIPTNLPDLIQTNVHIVRGLKPYTKYTFKVQSQNILGWSAFSNNSDVVQTLETAPSPPTNVVTKMNKNTISVSWSIPKDINGDRANLIYEVIFKSLNHSEQDLILQLEETTQSFNNLKYGSVYEVQVRAGNKVLPDLEKWSSFVTTSVELLEPSPDVSPVNVTAVHRGPHEIVVQWKIQKNYSISGYLIAYAKFDEGRLTVNRVANHTASRHVLKGLTADTSYDVKVAFYNAGGDGPYSEPVLVKTGLAHFTVEKQTDDGLLLSGSTIAIIAGTIGGALLLILLVIIIVQTCRLKKRVKKEEPYQIKAKENLYVENDTSNLEFDDGFFNTVTSRSSGVRGMYDLKQAEHESFNTTNVSTDTAYTLGANQDKTMQPFYLKPGKTDVVFKGSLGRNSVIAYNPAMKEPLGEHTEIELDHTAAPQPEEYLDPVQHRNALVYNGQLPYIEHAESSVAESPESHQYAELESNRTSTKSSPIYAEVNKDTKKPRTTRSDGTGSLGSRKSTGRRPLTNSTPQKPNDISFPSSFESSGSQDPPTDLPQIEDTPFPGTFQGMLSAQLGSNHSRSWPALGLRGLSGKRPHVPLDSSIFMDPNEFDDKLKQEEDHENGGIANASFVPDLSQSEEGDSSGSTNQGTDDGLLF